MAFNKNYLPAETQPWAREVQKRVENTETAFRSAEVNNTTRDDQLASSLRQVQAASAAATTAANSALAAINGLTGLGTAGGDYSVDGANLVVGSVTANEIDAAYIYAGNISADQINAGTLSADYISGGTIDGISITGGDLNTTAANGLSVEISGSSAVFKSGGVLKGQVSADSAGRLLVYGESGLYLNAGASGTTNFGSGGFTVGDSANLTVQGRIISAGTYNAVASSTANLLINSNNYFQRTTSSRRYKSDIQDIDYGMKALELRPRTWVDKSAYEENDNSTDGLTRITGFIAEEIHDLGLTELVQYNEEGLPEAVNYDRLMVGVIPILKQQQQLIETLITRIEALEG